MFNITPHTNIPSGINPVINNEFIKRPYQKHNPAKGEELDEFINNPDDDDEDYEQTESTINDTDNVTNINHPSLNHPRKFPDDDSNVGDDPEYPDSDEVTADEEDDDDDEIVTSIGY